MTQLEENIFLNKLRQVNVTLINPFSNFQFLI